MSANNTSVLLISSQNKTHKGWKGSSGESGALPGGSISPSRVILFVPCWPSWEEPNVPSSAKHPNEINCIDFHFWLAAIVSLLFGSWSNYERVTFCFEIVWTLWGILPIEQCGPWILFKLASNNCWISDRTLQRGSPHNWIIINRGSNINIS